MHSDEIHARPQAADGTLGVTAVAREEDLTAVATLFASTFGRSTDVQRARLSKLARGALSVLRRENALIGAIVTRTRSASFGDRLVPAACMSSLAVDAAVRGQGLGRALVVHALAGVARRDIPLALMHPTDFGLYRPTGFVIGGLRWLAEIAAECVAPVEHELTVRTERDNDAQSLIALQRESARMRAGHVVFNECEIRARGRKPYATWLVDDRDEIAAAVTFAHREIQGTMRVLVRSFCARRADAARALWTLLAKCAGPRGTIAWHAAPDEPLLALIDEPLLTLACEPGMKITALGPWMLRITSVPAALAARGYALGVDVGLSIAVEDALFPGNCGPWRLTSRDGRARIERCAHAALKIDVAALARLYAGAATANDLAHGHAIVGSESDVRAIDALFRSRAASLPDLV